MKKIIFLLFFTFCGQTKAQTVTIPDAHFAAFLQYIIPSAISGNQLNISSPAVTTLQKMEAQSENISDLNGIQYFTSLKFLNCQNNPLMTYLPTLPNTLDTLYCLGNGLTSLPALPNSLSYLDCSYNSLTNLPTLPNSLTYLECSTNSLTTLPALPNSLTFMDCQSNQLNSLPTLSSTSLTYLYCGLNAITNIPSLPNTLQTFYCAWNQITSMPFLPTSLQYFNCDSNLITCFPPFPNSILQINISHNLFNCLPNYVYGMNAATLAYPLCANGNSNGCAVTVDIESITYKDYQITVYPNPSAGNLYINIENNYSNEIDLQIQDITGKKVISQKLIITNSIAQLQTNLENGVYLLVIKDKSGNIVKQKIIVNN